MVKREPFAFASLRHGKFDYAIHGDYRVCRIDEVHEEAREDA